MISSSQIAGAVRAARRQGQIIPLAGGPLLDRASM